MNVSDLMTKRVESCHLHDDVARAAQIMWENDCGAVPVVDDSGRVVGILTDRDICMAGYTQGKRYAEIPVATAMAKKVFAIGAHDSVESAEMLMREQQIRRLPVVDRSGQLLGILSLNDIARHHPTRSRRGDGLSGETIAQTLAAICAPHHHDQTLARTAE